MSTQSRTQDQPAASQQDTGPRANRPDRGGPSRYRIAAVAIGAVAAAALAHYLAHGNNQMAG